MLRTVAMVTTAEACRQPKVTDKAVDHRGNGRTTYSFEVCKLSFKRNA